MNYQYSMQNMTAMPPPVLPLTSMPDMNSDTPHFIGPIVPENTHQNEDMNIEDDNDDNDVQFVSTTYNEKSNNSRESDRDNRRERDRDKDKGRPTRFQNRFNKDNRNSRDRSDRGDRHDRSREREWKDKRHKWSNDKNGQNNQGKGPRWNKEDDEDKHAQGQGPGQMGMPNMVMPGAMMPYSNMNNMINPQQMDMSNMSNMSQSMATMPPPMTNMISGINMMPMRVMGESMMMMNPMMPMIPNQAIYITDAVLLPPLPGEPIPNRRDRPPGCRTIFVCGLPNRVNFNLIEEIFHSFGRICDFKLHRQGNVYVRFEEMESVERSFALSGYRIKFHDQSEIEARTLFIDYALNRDDQSDFERDQNRRETTPPRIREPCSPGALSAIIEKIKSDEQFADAASTLVVWLERGECNKKNANVFYSLIQASNNHVRRLCNEKMSLDEEYHKMKSSIRDKFARVVSQFEQVAKILTAAKHQRVSDHFTKQQRRNVEMWLKMTEEMDNIKEELNTLFDDEDSEKSNKNTVPIEKYEELQEKNKNLTFELEGYKNEAYLAKDEAERKFEKFKAQFIAQQALQNKQQVPLSSHAPLPPPPMPNNMMIVPPLISTNKTQPFNADDTAPPVVPPSEAKLISILTAFLIVHPLGASLDYLFSYVKSMTPDVTQATLNQILQKYPEIFRKKTSGIGASMDHRWEFITFDNIKNES